jgi:hypothetical protein
MDFVFHFYLIAFPNHSTIFSSNCASFLNSGNPGGGNCPTGSESAGCRRALEYYLEHAIPPGYLWAWGASNLEQKVFADLIEKSDASFRSATRFLGIILANHLISAVDALVIARTRSTSSDGARIRVGGGFEPDPRGWRLEASLKVVW